MVSISLQGIDQLRAKLAAMGPNAQVELENGVVEEMRKVMFHAQRAVPVYSGALRSSAFVRTALRNQGRTDWTFGYQAPYALFVHDHPNAHPNADGHPCACYATIHRPRPGMLRNGEGYKWLEKAVLARGDMVGAVFRRVRNALLIASGQRNAGTRPAPPQPPEAGGAVASKGAGRRGGGGMRIGSSKEKKTQEEREAEEAEKKRQAKLRRQQAMGIRQYLRAMLELAAKGAKK